MKPLGIVLHLTASRFGDAAQINKWHLAQGWSGIGYHYVVLNGIRNPGDAYKEGIDGTLEKGRADNVMGAHCKAGGMNRCTLGISCVGTPGVVPSGAKPAPASVTASPYLTRRQFRTLVDQAARLCIRHGLDPAGTFVHPVSGKTKKVISQHSDHESAKPFCASLNIAAVRADIVAAVAALKGGALEAAPVGIGLEVFATEAFDPSVETLLPEFAADPDGPEEPMTDVEEPTAEVEEPMTDVEEPTAEVEEPMTDVEEPTAEVEEPTAEVEDPLLVQ
jgi:hypothetical protein